MVFGYEIDSNRIKKISRKARDTLQHLQYWGKISCYDNFLNENVGLMFTVNSKWISKIKVHYGDNDNDDDDDDDDDYDGDAGVVVVGIDQR